MIQNQILPSILISQLLSPATAFHAEHNWASYDETASCTSKSENLVKYEFTPGIGNIVPGIDSRPDSIKIIDIVGKIALVPE